MEIEDRAEELIKKYIDILEDVGTIPSEVRKEAIRCSELCINSQVDLLSRANINDGGVLYAELASILTYLEEV